MFLKGLYNSQENTFLATYYPFLFHTTLVTSWCSGYHYCTNSLDKRCSRRVGDSQWWGMAGNEDKRVSSVSHAIKTIHHSSSPVLGSLFNKVADLQPANLLIKRLRYRSFLVIFLEFLRKLFRRTLTNGCFWKD